MVATAGVCHGLLFSKMEQRRRAGCIGWEVCCKGRWLWLRDGLRWERRQQSGLSETAVEARCSSGNVGPKGAGMENAKAPSPWGAAGDSGFSSSTHGEQVDRGESRRRRL